LHIRESIVLHTLRLDGFRARCFASPRNDSLPVIASEAKQSMAPRAALWIASRSLSSGALRADPVARNDDMASLDATKQPAGQITKNLSIPHAKNKSLNPSGKSPL
jgi:hypothetical protein